MIPGCQMMKLKPSMMFNKVFENFKNRFRSFTGSTVIPFHLERNPATALISHKPPPTYSPHPHGSGGHTLSCGVMKLLACLSPTSPPHPLKFPGYLLSRFLTGCPALSFVLVFMSLYFSFFFEKILKENNALQGFYELESS